MEDTDNMDTPENSVEVDTIERNVVKKSKKSTKTDEEIYQTRMESQRKAVETRKAQCAAKKELLTRVAEAESKLTVEKLAVKTQKRMNTQSVNDELVRRLDDLTKQLEGLKGYQRPTEVPPMRPTKVQRKEDVQPTKETPKHRPAPQSLPAPQSRAEEQRHAPKMNLSSMGF